MRLKNLENTLKMTINNLVDEQIAKVKEMTVNYRPNPTKLNDNKMKCLYALAATGGTYMLPGDHPTLATVTLLYAGLKGYQAVRDWADK